MMRLLLDPQWRRLALLVASLAIGVLLGCQPGGGGDGGGGGGY